MAATTAKVGPEPVAVVSVSPVGDTQMDLQERNVGMGMCRPLA